MKNHATLIIFVILVNTTLGLDSITDTVCTGTNNRLSVPPNKEDHYQQLKESYTNCTYVEGNLEITWLTGFDLSFLENIREVTGYVLISHVDLPKLDLPRLQVIRGKKLFKLHTRNDEFALFVTMNKIFTLGIPALRDINNGSVGIYNNYNLCHVRTIDWDDIISGFGSKYIYVYNFTSPERTCPECDKSCEQGCWDDGPENCQRFSKINCSPECRQNRCFSSNVRDCCHENCIGGCTGPTATDCVACRYAKDNGECVSICPQDKDFLAGNCVAAKKTDRVCKVDADSNILNSENIDKLKGCVIIEGSLDILDKSFDGYQEIYTNFSFGSGFKPMHPDKLEILSTVKNITGSLIVQASHQDFRNLSYLRNLEVIGGGIATEQKPSLHIIGSSLTSLGLRSLKKIESGSVTITNNLYLCYASSLDWRTLLHSTDQEITISRNKDENDCIASGFVCDEECSMQGCWGPGPDQCISCKNVILDGVCATNCNKTRVYPTGYHTCKTCPEEDHYFEADAQRCGPCDPQCQTCYGPSPNECTECKNFKLFANANDVKNNSASFTCVDQCPTDHLTKGLCFDKSVTNPIDIDSNSKVLDDFFIVDSKAINNYKPHHDESNGVCKGLDADHCNACKHVRDSLTDFLKSFPKYQRVRSD